MRTTKTYPVVMLPTEKASHLIIDDNSQKLFHIDTPKEAAWGHQHIYLIDSAKEGDDIVCIKNGLIGESRGINKEGQVSKCVFENSNDGSIWKKIIASTDKSLTPNSWIPESFVNAFIKAHNEQRPITEVTLEIVDDIQTDEYYQMIKKLNLYDDRDQEIYESFLKVKTRDDGSVVTHKSKTYDYHDVVSVLMKFGLDENLNLHMGDGKILDSHHINKWIDNNFKK